MKNMKDTMKLLEIKISKEAFDNGAPLLMSIPPGKRPPKKKKKTLKANGK